VIVPPGPGVLCAYGDATTRVQDEASRTYLTLASALDLSQLRADLDQLRQRASESLIKDGISPDSLDVVYQADIRYVGQAFQITVDVTDADLERHGLEALTSQFDAEHEQLFTFKLGDGHEILMIRAVVSAASSLQADVRIDDGSGDISGAIIQDSSFYYEGAWHDAPIVDRSRLGAGDCVHGPAIVLEMDSTTIVLPAHSATVDKVGNLLIQPLEVAQ